MREGVEFESLVVAHEERGEEVFFADEFGVDSESFAEELFAVVGELLDVLDEGFGDIELSAGGHRSLCLGYSLKLNYKIRRGAA